MNDQTMQGLLAAPVTPADHIFGPESAKITLVEYGDFECPLCRQAYPVVRLLLKHFEDQLRFVFRQFPLREVHRHAELAAEAAEVAGGQQKFWRMHNLLLEKRLHLNAQNLRRCAEEVELDLVRYDFEMNDHIYLQRVQENIESGVTSGVRAAPTFFVNGVMHDVSFGIGKLRTAIEAAVR